MAAIDYTIPGQFKGVQIEPPENAMMRAMQLRGLQEASQLNALKMQEYQQDVMEKNELAKIYANPNLKPGSQEFFNEIYRRAPRAADKLATAEVQRQLALSTQQTREQQRREAEQKLKKDEEDYRSGVRNNRLIQIANAETPEEAYEMLQHYYGQGDLGYADYKSLAPQLIENPNWEKTRTSLLARTLPAEKQLTVPFDIEKVQLGVRKERSEVQAKELDQALAGFNKTFNPAFISTTDKNVGLAYITQRLRAMYEHPILGAEAKKFMPYEAALQQHRDAYSRDPEGYAGTLMGLTGEKIIEARQKAEERREKDIRAAYEEYVFEEALKDKIAGSYSEFKADYLAKQGAAPAPAPEPAVASAAASTDESTAAAAPRLVEAQGFGRNVARPEAAPAIAPAAAPASETAAKDELPSLPPVEVNYGIQGVSAAVVSLLRGTPEGRRELAKLAQAEHSPSAAANRKLNSDRLLADITHRQNMEDIARRSENRQKDEAEERKRHNKVLEGIQKSQFYLLADKPNQVANTQVDDNGTVTHYNARGQVIRSIPNAGKRSPELIRAEEAKAESKRTLDALIPELTKIIEPGGLIDQSTGSGIGRLADVTSEFFGVANEGAIAARELQPIASMVLMTVPRFQGPQSDKDVIEYNKAAGQLADPTLPAKIRRAAGKVVLDLMKKRRNEFVLRGSELDAGGAGSVEPPAGFVRDK